MSKFPTICNVCPYQPEPERPKYSPGDVLRHKASGERFVIVKPSTGMDDPGWLVSATVEFDCLYGEVPEEFLDVCCERIWESVGDPRTKAEKGECERLRKQVNEKHVQLQAAVNDRDRDRLLINHLRDLIRRLREAGRRQDQDGPSS
jgi:hypothetical protein